MERRAAVFFDVDDTLYDLSWPFGMAVRDMFNGRYDDKADDLFIRTRFHTDAVFEDYSCGRMSPEDFHAYRHEAAFSDCGISISRDEAMELLSLYRSYQKKIAMSDVIKDMLRKLDEKGVVTGVISNGVSAPQWEKIRTLRIPELIPEERIIVSGDVGFVKPHREIFDLTRDRLGLAGSELWYVGDNFSVDIEAARSAGWKTVWINKRQHVIPDGSELPDHTALSEENLSSILLSLF